jgi:spermidine/putrescine transport system permease protein
MTAEATVSTATRNRIALALLLAPALVWLVGLIVLPHVELAVISLRARVAPRVYAWSLDSTGFVDSRCTGTFDGPGCRRRDGHTLLIAFPAGTSRRSRPRSLRSLCSA